jgi:hypothetical protein
MVALTSLRGASQNNDTMRKIYLTCLLFFIYIIVVCIKICSQIMASLAIITGCRVSSMMEID